MPEQSFLGDPYLVLNVSRRASDSTIKRRWRELAREHHPDRAAGDRDEAARLTGRMARINAAYDLLRDPFRRARYDTSAEGRRSAARAGEAPGPHGGAFGDGSEEWVGPPPPPPSPPVTARFDTTSAFRPRNTTLSGSRSHPLASQPVRSRPRAAEQEPLRASSPSGPVEVRRARRSEPPPRLRDARETELAFGRFRGYTLGEVELMEPAYIDWIASTITRDRDLVAKARVIRAELDRRGVIRRTRPVAPGFGSRTAVG
jgi:curved DNA-binding protein CbpA